MNDTFGGDNAARAELGARKTHPRGSPSHLGAHTPSGDRQVPVSTWAGGPGFREQSLPGPSHLASQPTPIRRPRGAEGRALQGAPDEGSTPPGTADLRLPVPRLPLRHPSCREMPQPRLSPCGLNPNLQPTAPNRRTAPAHGGERAHEENALEDGSPEGA